MNDSKAESLGGVAGAYSEDRALSVIRENSRRYAHTERGQAVNNLAARTVVELDEQLPADIDRAVAGRVLLCAASALGILEAQGLTNVTALLNIAGFAGAQLVDRDSVEEESL